ncbi:MAG TPA: hypothetical protein VGT41_01075 [Candidatus Babeliales bacterium]|nr:hypothetical protein [Candidatus Babeliales bacterium]
MFLSATVKGISAIVMGTLLFLHALGIIKGNNFAIGIAGIGLILDGCAHLITSLKDRN